MIFNVIKNTKFLLIIIILILLWNCSPKFSHDVKMFLFDGVPDPYKVEISLVKDTLTIEDSTSVKLTSRINSTKNSYNLHPPYRKRECSSCHDKNAMGRTKLPTPELCYTCHDNFDGIYEFLHGPVAAGNCSQCHNPHKSKLNNLLLNSGQDLCLSCHYDSLFSKDKIHKGNESENCTKCHNAHGGSNSFSLQAESCYECHDNYQKKFKFLHAPIASGNCSQCHESHKSDKSKLLKYSKENLCKNCHDSKGFYKEDYHRDTKDKNCSECHDPHGGSNKNFIF